MDKVSHWCFQLGRKQLKICPVSQSQVFLKQPLAELRVLPSHVHRPLACHTPPGVSQPTSLLPRVMSLNMESNVVISWLPLATNHHVWTKICILIDDIWWIPVKAVVICLMWLCLLVHWWPCLLLALLWLWWKWSGWRPETWRKRDWTSCETGHSRHCTVQGVVMYLQ